MNELKIFENTEFGKVRTVMVEDEPYLVGKDIAEILGYTDTKKAIQDHVDVEDKLNIDGVAKTPPHPEKVGILDSLGRTQYPVLINESGFYSLVLSSKLPKAKQFKRWVTAEVLPSIRKTGMYATEDKMMEYCKMAINEPDKLVVEILKQMEVQRELQKRNKELEPKAEFFDSFISADGTITTTSIAKAYNMSATKLNKILHEMGIIFKQSKKRWYPYAQYNSVMKPTSYIDKSGRVQMEYRWTTEGARFVYEELKNKKGLVPISEQVTLFNL